jgi:hypothetical protein
MTALHCNADKDYANTVAESFDIEEHFDHQDGNSCATLYTHPPGSFCSCNAANRDLEASSF